MSGLVKHSGVQGLSVEQLLASAAPTPHRKVSLTPVRLDADTSDLLGQIAAEERDILRYVESTNFAKLDLEPDRYIDRKKRNGETIRIAVMSEPPTFDWATLDKLHRMASDAIGIPKGYLK